jgi:hypothetical protein
VDDLPGGLRRILGKGETVDLFIVDVERALEGYRAISEYNDYLGDPRDIGDGLEVVANATDALAKALSDLPPAGWFVLWSRASGDYVRFSDSKSTISQSPGRELLNELSQIAQVARDHSAELEGVRRNTLYLRPNVTKAVYARDQMVNRIARCYRRHIGSLDVAGWSEGSVFAKVIDAVLSFAGLDAISDRTLRNVLGKSWS